VIRSCTEPTFAILADLDEAMEYLAFSSFCHRILQQIGVHAWVVQIARQRGEPLKRTKVRVSELLASGKVPRGVE
jgi:hypothetical protein